MAQKPGMYGSGEFSSKLLSPLSLVSRLRIIRATHYILETIFLCYLFCDLLSQRWMECHDVKDNY